MTHDFSCAQFTAFIMDWLDGELPDGERTVFEQHLRLCPPCVHYLETYKRTVELGRQCHEAPPGPPPPDVAERLLAAMRAARRGPPGGSTGQPGG